MNNKYSYLMKHYELIKCDSNGVCLNKLQYKAVFIENIAYNEDRSLAAIAYSYNYN